MAFNFHNMEEELVHTVMEDEEFSSLSGGQVIEPSEDSVRKKSPGKFAVALIVSAGILGGAVYGLHVMPTDYAYGQTEALYQECLGAIADSDWQTANALTDELLEQDKANLQYLALKNTILETMGDTDAQVDVLKKIIDADTDNNPAYVSLLQIYVNQNNQAGIVELADKAPNASLSKLLKEYLVDTPYFSIDPGVYTYSQELEILFPDDLNVYYTLDGTSPIERGRLYVDPIPLEEGLITVNAVCCNENGIYGEVLSGEYQIGDVISQTGTQLSEPKVYPIGGTYSSSQMITIDVPMGLKAYYSWEAGDALTTQNGTLYSGGITMPEGSSVLAVIIADEDGNTSAVKQIQYTYQPQTAE